MAKLSDRILGERVSGYVTKPNLLDNSNFQIHQRGVNDGGGTGSTATYIDRYSVRGSNGTGGTLATAVTTLNRGELPYRVFRLQATGNTDFSFIRQNFKTERIKGNTDYTFTLRTNLMDTPIKMKAKLRGRDVSAGAWAELGEGDLELDSYGTYSVTFFDVNSSLPLTQDADYIQIELTGAAADNGSDFVLPDGAYRWEWFKLEEGNVFTGYEPTPYAIDEAECLKWLRVWSQPRTTVYGTDAGTRGYDYLDFWADMYFTPTTSGIVGSGTSTITPKLSGLEVRANSGGNNYGINISAGGLVTCEL